ncbi:MAG: RidA family protein [Rickettsiales bacterium]|nr:RidA family protein [Rickettsiales bacterium]
MTNAIEQKLAALNITLPPSVPPAANYIPYTVSGNLVFVSGTLPMKDGKPQDIGKLGKEFTVEQGQATARLCGINILGHVKAACGGDLSKVKRVVRLGIFVSSAAGFTDQPKVANGVSDLMVELFGEAGKHARFAVGVSELPFGVAVEVDGTFEIG